MKKMYWLKEFNISWLQFKICCHKNAAAVQNIKLVAQLQDSKNWDLARNSPPR